MKIMKTPKAVDIAITTHCNLRCKYCAHFTSASDVQEDLPLKEWLTFFEELNRCTVMKVTLSGGEPFSRENINEIIEGIVRNRMRFNILSNGTLITDEMAAFLSSTGRCDGVQVSIDGSVPITHDSFRSKGSFYKAMDGIKFLQKHNVPVHARITIHRKNIRDIENVAELLLEDFDLPSFSANSACYMGLCRQNSEQVQLTIEERGLAMETLLKLNQKYNGRISATAGPLAEARAWLEMEQARREGKDEMPGRGYLTACSGMMKTLAVRADGVMVPCGQISNIELGRINKDDLLEVWQNHQVLNRFRERRNISLRSFNYCYDCDYIRHCTGGCPALACTMLNDAYQPCPDCLKQFLEEGGKLPDEKILFVEAVT